MDDEEYQPEDESLYPIKEDISEWLNTIMECKTTPDTLFEDIQTGRSSQPLPSPPSYSRRAMPGSFLARDNAANFISWCRKLGVNEAYMFESEGLVLQRQRRNVLLCLLEVARISSSLKEMPVPQLIRLEKAIDFEQENDHEILKRIGSPDDELSYVPPSSSRQKRKKALQLDNEVHKIVDNSKFKGSIDIERMGEGRYRIHDKLVFIRMLREKHVMVRVGGGWDSLQHYLDTHEVARARSAYKLLSFTEVLQENGTPNNKERKFHQYRTRIPLRTKQS